MSDSLLDLEHIAGAMLAGLSPAGRRAAARAVAIEMRRSQSARIAAQRNPDGTAYAPRKAKGLRGKKGALRRTAKAGPMFKKLRTTAFMTADATADEASVGFRGAAANRIARVHQLGLRDRVERNPNSPKAQYAARVLLGFSDADRQKITDSLLASLNT